MNKYMTSALDRAARWIENRRTPEVTDPYADLTAENITVTHTTGNVPDHASLPNGPRTAVTTFTARYKGTEIGSVRVKITARGYGYVHDMKVIPEARRHGTGHVLMKAVTDFYENVCRLELVAHSPGGDSSTAEQRHLTDEVLTRFYAKHGFYLDKTAAERPGTRPSDARRMSRNP